MEYNFFRLNNKNYNKFIKMTYPYYQNFYELLDKKFIAFGTEFNNISVALALLEIKTDSLNLVSIFVKKEYRKNYIALNLMNFIIEELSDFKKIEVIYETNRSYTIALENILRKCKFNEPKIKSYVGRCFTDNIAKAHWVKRERVLYDFNIILWKDIFENEKNNILKNKEKLNYPEFLSPFSEENIIEYQNSLALKNSNNEIIGWIITHRIAKDTIRYSRIFVEEKYQKFGLAIILLTESIKIHTSTYLETGINKATFVVDLQNAPQMARFVEKRMKPYIDKLNCYFRSEKYL